MLNEHVQTALTGEIESNGPEIETQATSIEIESDGHDHHEAEGTHKQHLLHPDSLVPFHSVLHPDNLEPFHPVYEDSSVLLTQSGRFKLPKERLFQLQRIWRSLDQIAPYSPRPNEANWNQVMKRYRPAAAVEGASFENDDTDWKIFGWRCPIAL